MKFIYHCYGGSHSSVTAAAIHLGFLNKDKKPKPEDLMGLPFFDKQTDKDHGLIKLMGKDEQGNEVYICGCRSLGSKMEAPLKQFAEVMKLQDNNVIFVDTLKGVNNLMRLGGYISRKLRLVSIGRPIVLIGTIKSFNKFVEIVEDVKEVYSLNKHLE